MSDGTPTSPSNPDAPSSWMDGDLHLPAPHGPVHRAIEAGAVAVTLSLASIHAVRLFLGASALADGHPSLWLWLAASVVAGIFAADFASGLIHWTFDRYGSPNTPFLGKNFISPFRIHHVDPDDITRHGFIETNGNTSLLAAPVLALAFLLEVNTPALVFAQAATLVTALLVVGTNQFHKWAHMEKPPFPIGPMQRAHLILGRAHHDVHHTFPYEKNYCITTGWLNRPLMAINFWANMERGLALLGAKAHRDAAPVERHGLLLRKPAA